MLNELSKEIHANAVAHELEEYRKLGSRDLFATLLELATPRFVPLSSVEFAGEEYESYGCPSCGNDCVGDIGTAHCFSCGQRLDWSEYMEETE